MNAIAFKNVAKFYDSGGIKNFILKNCSFGIPRGAFISIVGRSGLGKTTVLKLMSGIDKIDHGEIFINKICLSNYKEKDLQYLRQSVFGFVFQNFHLLPMLSVEENALLPIYFQKEKLVSTYRNRLHQLIEMLHLPKEILCRKPSELSGGEMQRIAMIRSLIHQPSILFADEPTGNLDAENETNIMNIFKNISKEFNTTIIVVTHSNYVSNFTDSVLTLNKGVLTSERNEPIN